jgi:hypothetical protein
MQPMDLRRRRLPLLFAALLALAACLAGAVLSTTGAAAAGPQKLAFYSVSTKQIFINNTDDLARGQGHNPFGNYAHSSVGTPRNEKLFGPFAGDEAEYAFALYTDTSHKTKAGSAIFICQYDFNQNSFCDAALELDGGTLIGKGAFNFNATTYSLAIVGGTGSYRTLRGHLDGAALGPATQKQPVHRSVPMLQQQRLSLAVAPAASSRQQLTQYSTPAHETFVGNIDDETRGAVSNPFGTHTKGAASTKEQNNGPFPGDEVLFSFSLYRTAKLAASTGSAVYTCWYAFDKDAFCDVLVQPKTGGALLAAGTLNFDAKTFALAVTGGTGPYRGVAGDLVVTPSGKHAQRLAIDLG